MRAMIVAASLALLAGFISVEAWGQEHEPMRVLLLTSSQGFEHSAIREKDGKPGHVQTVLQTLIDANEAVLTSTKDASIINKKDLQSFDLVVFYTTGNLMKAGKGGSKPMGENGLNDLLAWIKAGGAFMAYHSSTDTFGHYLGDPKLPYINMIGAEFRKHGSPFTGTLRVVDPTHPAMGGLPDGFSIFDEWYLFKNMNKDEIHVLALLDPGDEREKQEAYNIPNYPIIWCREYGEGRVYYNAMGHMEDVWDTEAFQTSFISAAVWALDERPAQAKPNYKDVIPAPEKE